MTTAFSPTAFNNDAFQIDATSTSTGTFIDAGKFIGQTSQGFLYTTTRPGGRTFTKKDFTKVLAEIAELDAEREEVEAADRKAKEAAEAVIAAEQRRAQRKIDAQAEAVVAEARAKQSALEAEIARQHLANHVAQLTANAAHFIAANNPARAAELQRLVMLSQAIQSQPQQVRPKIRKFEALYREIIAEAESDVRDVLAEWDELV